MLIACVTMDTPENRRFECTDQTLHSLQNQVDLKKHRVFLVDNGSTDERTHELLKEWESASWATVIRNGENLGTARAINKAWKHRSPGEAVCKIDNDVTVERLNWPDLFEEVLRRMPKAGLFCGKRKDLGEEPEAAVEHARTRLLMVPHKPGEDWITVEQVFGPAMGTLQVFSSALIDRIGGLYQMQDEKNEQNLYGWEDSLVSCRAQLAGFMVVFIPEIRMTHVDPGNTAWTQEKREMAKRSWKRFEAVRDEYITGKRPLFWEDE